MLKQGVVIQRREIKTVVFLVSLLLLSPAFVFAGKCYVDDDASSGGDGSKNNPYQTIVKALDKECNNIKVSKGTYKEDIKMGKGVDLEGNGKSTVITGSVTMNNNTELTKVYIKNDGIKVAKGANVKIDSIKISGADIGIKTIGEGKLTVRNSKISYSGKGFYIQYGKDIDIQDCEVTHNEEEAIDIRANVDGIIMNNVVDSNKESGIEVIAGRSTLEIKNNKLRYNGSSGIAVQFYKSTKNLGDLKISGNNLQGNRRYGVDCKIPSGGNPMPGYWNKSVHFQYNKISGNGMGELADFCKFTDEAILKATKTPEEIAELKKTEEERKAKLEADKLELEKISEEERIKIEEEKKREEEALKKEQQKREDLYVKGDIEKILQEGIEKSEDAKIANAGLLKERSKWKIFFVGIDERVVENFEKQISERKNSLEKTEKLAGEIKTEEIGEQVKQVVEDNHNYYENLVFTANEYKNKFGLMPWFRKIF
jgi:hypothetical protein